MLEVLELAAGGGKELLADSHVVIHRPADVEEQQDLHRVVPLRHHAYVEQSRAPRRRIDGAIQVKRFRGALARETTQPAERQLDVSRAELD